MTTTSYLLKLEEQEKARWREYAKEHYRNNLARMIRVAVNQMIERGHDQVTTSSFDDSNIIRAVESTRNEIKDQLNRIEDILNQYPKLPLGTYLQAKQDENATENNERELKYDF